MFQEISIAPPPDQYANVAPFPNAVPNVAPNVIIPPPPPPQTPPHAPPMLVPSTPTNRINILVCDPSSPDSLGGTTIDTTDLQYNGLLQKCCNSLSTKNHFGQVNKLSVQFKGESFTRKITPRSMPLQEDCIVTVHYNTNPSKDPNNDDGYDSVGGGKRKRRNTDNDNNNNNNNDTNTDNNMQD